MKKRITEAMSYIDEDLIREAAGEPVTNATKPLTEGATFLREEGAKAEGRKRPFWEIPAIAVCAAVVVAGIFLGIAFKTGMIGTKPQKPAAKEDEETVQKPTEEETDVYDLLIISSGFNIGNYQALYQQIYKPLAEKEIGKLEENTGVLVSETADGVKFFGLKGREDLQYVITENGEYNLWKFYQFNGKNYPYRDVLEMVYNVTAAEDIQKIVVKPSLSDNTDEGKKLQAQIGVRTISDRKDIERFYRILTGIDRSGEVLYMGSGREEFLADRYLEIVLSDGRTIDALKYYAVSGNFYEFGGLCYNGLSEEDQEWLKAVMGIHYDASGVNPVATPTPTPLPDASENN